MSENKGILSSELPGRLFPQKPRMKIPRLWKSLPLTRLSGKGRTGVGHRRRARQRTSALNPQTERGSALSKTAGVSEKQLLVGVPRRLRERGAAFRPSLLPSPRSDHNLPVHPVLLKQRSCEAESGGRGGNYFPRIAFPAFPAFPVFRSGGRGGCGACNIRLLYLYFAVSKSNHAAVGASGFGAVGAGLRVSGTRAGVRRSGMGFGGLRHFKRTS